MTYQPLKKNLKFQKLLLILQMSLLKLKKVFQYCYNKFGPATVSFYVFGLHTLFFNVVPSSEETFLLMDLNSTCIKGVKMKCCVTLP